MNRIATLALIACTVAATSTAQTAPTAKATLKDAGGKQVGTATLTQTPQGVLVHAEVNGLPAGPHGFHIHAVGKCEPPFTSAGGHFNPAGHKHGFEAAGGSHIGDMPNLFVGADGRGTVDAFAGGATIDPGAASLFGPAGTAIVVHANKDDYASDPAGNAGDRIACGVIEK